MEKKQPSNSPKLLSSELWNSQGIYRQKGTPRGCHGAVCRISTRGSTIRP